MTIPQKRIIAGIIGFIYPFIIFYFGDASFEKGYMLGFLIIVATVISILAATYPYFKDK